MRPSLFNQLSAMVLVGFTSLVFFPNWEVAVGFLAIVSFSCFIMWLNPTRKQEVSRSEFEKLEEETKSLKEQLTNLRIKIGFQRTA